MTLFMGLDLAPGTDVTVIPATEYLTFVRVTPPKLRKTMLWMVQSIHGDNLGRVTWFGRWRQYVFRPYEDTLYNPDCLETISKFCTALTQCHRAGRTH